MKLALFLLAAIAVLNCDGLSYETIIRDQWEAFKLKHNKIYSGETEEEYRLKIFMDKLHKINEHNTLYERGLSSYKLGVNKFSDLLPSEFAKKHLMHLPEPEIDLKEALIHEPNGNRTLERTLDWREKGAVTPVRDQGDQCGSCWSFGASGAMEAQWFKKTGKLPVLSPQNLIDCTREYGNLGCDGGWAHKSFQYISDNDGIDTESSYPYKQTDQQCKFTKSGIGATEDWYGFAKAEDETSLLSVLSEIGPAAATIDASDENFGSYEGGIYDNPSCGTKKTHIVLVIGYGNENGHDYWLIKNSWGKDWGENGYVRMSRNKENQCGIATLATYPIV